MPSSQAQKYFVLRSLGQAILLQGICSGVFSKFSLEGKLEFYSLNKVLKNSSLMSPVEKARLLSNA